MSQLNLTLRDTNVEIDDAVVAHRARQSTGVTLPGTPTTRGDREAIGVFLKLQKTGSGTVVMPKGTFSLYARRGSTAPIKELTQFRAGSFTMSDMDAVTDDPRWFAWQVGYATGAATPNDRQLNIMDSATFDPATITEFADGDLTWPSPPSSNNGLKDYVIVDPEETEDITDLWVYFSPGDNA